MNEAPPSVEMEITWHSADQQQIFHDAHRFITVRAGRRWGKTKGAFHRLSEICLERPTKHLWVDTTQANIEKYFDEHLYPLLPKVLYKWEKRTKVLKFKNKSLVHFGSIQIPENLEGFGYDYIWANEAGLIFKGPSGEKLWSNTIRPMAMEGTGARVIFIGTPKGKGLFEEFSDRGESDDPKWSDWATFHRISGDRPGITQKEIDALIDEYPGGVDSQNFRQEILAEFLESEEGEPVIPYGTARAAMEREVKLDESFHPVWGVDPSSAGDDAAGMCKRRGMRLMEPTKTKSGKLDGEIGAAWIKDEYENTEEEDRPKEILIDVIGSGEGWYTHARAMGLPVRGINWGQSAVDKERFYQRRDELWFKASEWCKKGGLAGDWNLVQEISKPLIDLVWHDKGKFKVESKEKSSRSMKSRLGKEGRSPNRADAFVLTFAAGLERKRKTSGFTTGKDDLGGKTWMSM